MNLYFETKSLKLLSKQFYCKLKTSMTPITPRSCTEQNCSIVKL